MEAVFFDMDGVLVDSEEQWKRMEQPFFLRLIPSWTAKDHARVVGLGVLDLYRLLKAEYGLKSPKDEFLKMCDEVAGEVYLRRVAEAAGFRELIAELKACKIPVGLASSSPHRWIKLVTQRFQLGPLFDSIVSADDVGDEGKPSPAIYLHAARSLKAKPERCAAIEDSTYGVTAAKAAGMACVGYRNGTNQDQDFAKADVEISAFHELNAERLLALLG